MHWLVSLITGSNTSSKPQGFTLIELMLVVTLMGLTTVLGLNGYYRFMNDARLNSGGKAIAGWLDQVRRMAIQNSKTCTIEINPAAGTLAAASTNICGNINPFNLEEQVGQGDAVQLCAASTDPTQTFTPCSSNQGNPAISVQFSPRGTTPTNTLIELRSAKQSHNRCIAVLSPLGLIRLGRVLNNRCDWTSAW
jgi:prepilin-type N-terminal cleavage/methylation domain-containing protein